MKNDSELILVTRSKDGDDKIVIYHLRTANQEISDDIVLVGDPGRTYEVAEFFDNGIESEIKNREFIILIGHYLGRPITAMGTGIGTDNQDIVIVEVHATTECDFQTLHWAKMPKKLRVIRVGTSGSPEAAPIGTLGISRYALGLDNTGIYYPHLSLDELVETIRQKFRRACRKSIAGIPLLEIYPNLKEYCLRKYGLDPTTWPEEKIKNRLFRFFQPYVAKMCPKAASALEQAASYLGFAHKSGISTSASGFYGPQGRVIGRAQPVLIPQLQDVLADFMVTDSKKQSKNLQVIFNEMEASLLARLGHEILGYNVGVICLVIANRAHKTFIKTKDEEKLGIAKGILTALTALRTLEAGDPQNLDLKPSDRARDIINNLS